MKYYLLIFAFATAIAVFNAWGFYQMGKGRGYSEGMEAAREIRDRVDCEFDYGYKPLEEVPARCLKYFDLEKLKK